MQFSSSNQERVAAKQVIGGPDIYAQTNSSRNAQFFRQATATTILHGTSAERYAPAGLGDEIDQIRRAATGNGHYFTGTA